MGLDMYLEADVYIGAHFEHRNVIGSIDIKINGEPVDIKLREVHSISLRVGYWRKANAIHKWFVENVQDGRDNCARYYVDPDKLKELRDIVEAVLADKSKAQELLPTQSGFFFGGTEYDEWYVMDLELTKEIIDRALKLNRDLYYQSSW